MGDGLTAGLAVTFASAIMNEYLEDNKSKGVTVTVQYLYVYTNDSVLGWTTGPSSWSFFY